MIGSYIEGTLKSVSAASVTEAFCILMLAIFALSIWQGRKGRHDLFLEHAPAVLVESPLVS